MTARAKMSNYFMQEVADWWVNLEQEEQNEIIINAFANQICGIMEK